MATELVQASSRPGLEHSKRQRHLGLQYRPELDGLRAVAIVPVVLVHSSVSIFGGGFVGVDIFFVISGYLITSVILAEMESGTFSFAAFYERRIRRLLLPLLVVIAATWAAATVILPPEAYEEFARSVAAAVAGLSNWYFLQNVGYFDGPAETKPLLHTWSLAIEEQFYLVFPLLLLGLRRFWARGVNGVLMALGALSFAMSLMFITSGEASDAFYNSLARFWELIAGVLIATGAFGTAPPRLVPVTRGLGAILILASILFADRLPFPGPGALPAVLGTALIIWSGPVAGDPVFRLLASRPFVAIGKVSYAWYLWHWPLLVFLPMIMTDSDSWSPWPQLVAAIASLGLAALSLPFIETPVRRKRVFRSRRAAFTLLGAGILMGTAFSAPGFLPHVSHARTELLFHQTARVLANLYPEK